jgi:hypothetical protein
MSSTQKGGIKMQEPIISVQNLVSCSKERNNGEDILNKPPIKIYEIRK